MSYAPPVMVGFLTSIEDTIDTATVYLQLTLFDKQKYSSQIMPNQMYHVTVTKKRFSTLVSQITFLLQTFNFLSSDNGQMYFSYSFQGLNSYLK